MTWGKIKLRPTDTLFSRYMRLKVKRCEVCKRKGEGDEGITGLCVSHFYGRRGESTRFSNENVSVLCSGCHRKFHERPSDYYDWMKKKLGEKRFKDLVLEANRFQKKDDKLAMIYIREKMRELI